MTVMRAFLTISCLRSTRGNRWATPIAVRDDRERTVASSDIRSVAPLGAITRCPVCRATEVRWFGGVRVCVAGTHMFPGRDTVPHQPVDVTGWVGGSDYDY